MTKNYGLNRHGHGRVREGARADGKLDGSHHRDEFGKLDGAGYVRADRYNDCLNRGGMTTYRAPGAGGS